MDMQLNQEIIRNTREARAWSQNHLAEVSGLSLRTIQRIEKTGQASLESAKALSAVLDIHLDELRKINSLPPGGEKRITKKVAVKIIGVAATFFATLMAIVWFSAASAAPVMIDLSVSTKDAVLADVHLLNKDNEESEMRIDDVLKVLVVPHKVENGVKLSVKFFQYSEKGYLLIASPEVITENNQSAEIHIESNTHESYRLVFKPHL